MVYSLIPIAPPVIHRLTSSLRKIPWRLSRHQKYRHRLRLRHVDSVVATVDSALAKQGLQTRKLERWKAEMPTEQEMLPKDKYTVFDRKVKKYRKGIHSEFFCYYVLVGMRECGFKVMGVEMRGSKKSANSCVTTEVPKWTRVSQRLNPPGF